LSGVTAHSSSSTDGKTVPTNGRVSMEPGEELTFYTATPGGYGDPADRPDELVERDVRLGYVSPERAAEVYDYETE
jgi:N-methylhydantoinase B